MSTFITESLQIIFTRILDSEYHGFITYIANKAYKCKFAHVSLVGLEYSHYYEVRFYFRLECGTTITHVIPVNPMDINSAKIIDNILESLSKKFKPYSQLTKTKQLVWQL